MAIIGILIGITFSGATYIYSAQQEKKALADMEALKLALEEFKSEHGDYPRTNDLEGDACLLYTSPSPRDRQKSRMPSSA